MTAKTANETSAPPGLEPVAHSTATLVLGLLQYDLFLGISKPQTEMDGVTY